MIVRATGSDSSTRSTLLRAGGAQDDTAPAGVTDSFMMWLLPDRHVVDRISFSFGLTVLRFGGVADVEGSDDVPVGFGSNGRSDRREAWFPGAPTDSDAERVRSYLEVLNGARCGGVILLCHFVVSTLY